MTPHLKLKTEVGKKRTFMFIALGLRKKLFAGDVCSYDVYIIDEGHFSCSMQEHPNALYQGKIKYYQRNNKVHFAASNTSEISRQQVTDVLDELFGDEIENIAIKYEEFI